MRDVTGGKKVKVVSVYVLEKLRGPCSHCYSKTTAEEAEYGIFTAMPYQYCVLIGPWANHMIGFVRMRVVLPLC